VSALICPEILALREQEKEKEREREREGERIVESAMCNENAMRNQKSSIAQRKGEGGTRHRRERITELSAVAIVRSR